MPMIIFIWLILILSITIPENVPRPEQQKIAEPKAPIEVIKEAEKTYKATIHYQLDFDWVYTGTPNMIRYAGQETLEATERNCSETGLPVMAYFPESTFIKFRRYNGDTCELSIPVIGNVYRSENYMIPIAQRVAIKCPDSNDLKIVEAHVERLGRSHEYYVFAALTRDEVRNMTKTAGF